MNLGLTNKKAFHEKIYNRTYNRCFWPQDIFGVRDSDLISISNEGHPRIEGKLRIHTGDGKTLERIELESSDKVDLTIVWNSYHHMLYFYEEDRLIGDFGFEETDTEFVPFIYLYYDRVYEKSDCLVSLGNTKIQFT